MNCNINWKEVKLLVLDTDGVLTDGGVYFLSNGEQFRRFNIKDGTGMRGLVDAGIGVVIVSSSPATPVLYRARQLDIQEVHTDVSDKLRLVKDIASQRKVPLSQVAYIGDDLSDIPVLEMVGVPCATADADKQVKKIALYVTRASGGQGAVREVADLILSYLT